MDTKREYTYRACVDWLPEMDVASLEVSCTYNKTDAVWDAKKITQFLSMFILNVKEMALQGMADRFVVSKMNNVAKTKVVPARMGMFSGDEICNLTFKLSSTIISREDAVDVIHIDTLENAMWGSICHNVLSDKAVVPPPLEGQPAADSLSPAASQHI